MLGKSCYANRITANPKIPRLLGRGYTGGLIFKRAYSYLEYSISLNQSFNPDDSGTLWTLWVPFENPGCPVDDHLLEYAHRE